MEKVYIKDNVVVRNVKEYLKPEYIYLKIDGKLLVKERSYIKKGDYVTNNIISPISGIVRNTIYKRNINNDMVKYIVIENDYKEKMNRDSKRKKISISSEIRYVLINGIDEIYTSFKRNIIDNYSNLLLEAIDNLTNGIIDMFI